MHRPIAFAATALVTGALLTSPSSASAVGETCQGKPATIVGTGPGVVGTPGDDVIVSGSSTGVIADAGNDLICVSGPNFVQILAGSGDDVVDASGTTATNPETETLTDLGTGRDRFLGSPFLDTVYSDGTDDHVSTGLGRDHVWITITAMPTGVLGSYDGGGGSRGGDLFRLYSEAFDVEVGLDASLNVDGVRAASVTGFRRAEVAAPSVVLRGNAVKNLLTAHGCDIRINGLGGKDVLDTALNFAQPVFPCDRTDRTIRLSGGNGNDRLFGGPGNVILSGGRGSDQLTGDEGGDALVGGPGNDSMLGGDGPDVLLGGPGRDVTDGQDGRDKCVGEVERRCER